MEMKKSNHWCSNSVPRIAGPDGEPCSKRSARLRDRNPAKLAAVSRLSDKPPPCVAGCTVLRRGK